MRASDLALHRSPATNRTGAGQPHFDEITFPVDIVYTWVDNQDPDWVASKNLALRGFDRDDNLLDSDSFSRYSNRDELRYSLRSVADFADFVRHIFIVTDGQAPPWLNVNHERLTLVSHRDIFRDDAHLPTFNSHAIECHLHHISGLAEHYLYLNDDFFFGRPVTAGHFFHGNGMTRMFLSDAAIAQGDMSDTAWSVDAAAMNTRRLVHERFGRCVSQKIKHAPYPQRRSILYEMEAILHGEFETTAASRVRGSHDVAVPSSLFHYYAYLTGRAVPGKISSRYVSLGDKRLKWTLRALRRRAAFDVVCINDSIDASADDGEKRQRALGRFMESYWPTKSPFER